MVPWAHMSKRPPNGISIVQPFCAQHIRVTNTWTDRQTLMQTTLRATSMGALQRGPGGPWPTQNFGWVGHNALGPTNIGMYVP